MTKKYLKRCSTSLAIREMPIRAVLRSYPTEVRAAKIIKTTDNKRWRGCREGNPHSLLVELDISVENSQNAKTHLPYGPATPWPTPQIGVQCQVIQ